MVFLEVWMVWDNRRRPSTSSPAFPQNAPQGMWTVTDLSTSIHIHPHALHRVIHMGADRLVACLAATQRASTSGAPSSHHLSTSTASYPHSYPPPSTDDSASRWSVRAPKKAPSYLHWRPLFHTNWLFIHVDEGVSSAHRLPATPGSAIDRCCPGMPLPPLLIAAAGVIHSSRGQPTANVDG